MSLYDKRKNLFAPYQGNHTKEIKAAELICYYTALSEDDTVHNDFLQYLLRWENDSPEEHNRMLAESARLYSLIHEEEKQALNLQLAKLRESELVDKSLEPQQKSDNVVKLEIVEDDYDHFAADEHLFFQAEKELATGYIDQMLLAKARTYSYDDDEIVDNYIFLRVEQMKRRNIINPPAYKAANDDWPEGEHPEEITWERLGKYLGALLGAAIAYIIHYVLS